VIEAIELTSTRRSRGARGGPVEKVSFDVYPGQVTALLGASGTGKSTVLRMMVELEPGGGRTLFGGRPFHALRPAIREVGLALNPGAVHPGRTVQAHLQLYSAAGGVPKGRVAEVLEVAGLSTQATVRCGRLDPGQRQRLSIAAALLGDPAALILDEPHALDDHGMSWFHALIRAYAAQGRTVLVAATDPDTLSGTADHVVILRRDEHDGISRVIASRSAAEVFDECRVTVVQVRSPQAARLAAALETEGARLAQAGPGALQVRGLDRARIGELAHVAGICLHELTEIGHDEDVFGLRPVPRQKELLPGLNRADAIWHTGVRVVAEQIEEAEVVEAEAEAEVAEVGEVGEVAAEVIAEEPVTVAAAAKTKTQTEAQYSGGDELPAQGAATAKAEAQSSVGEGLPAQGAAAGSPASGTEVKPSQSTIAGPRESPAKAGGGSDRADARARWRSQSSQWWAVKSVADTDTDSDTEAQPVAESWASSATGFGSPSAESAGNVRLVKSTGPQVSAASTDSPLCAAARDSASSPAASTGSHPGAAARDSASSLAASTDSHPGAPAQDSPSSLASTAVIDPASSIADSHAEAQPIVVRSVEAPALRRSSTFGRRWGRERPAESQSPAPAQPAVPFTIAAPAPGVAEEGMTPWRAVTVRAGQNQQQVSVAEAAPAEQETSA
jgi:ABC-type multidrug transport system ATPase subunit